MRGLLNPDHEGFPMFAHAVLFEKAWRIVQTQVAADDARLKASLSANPDLARIYSELPWIRAGGQVAGNPRQGPSAAQDKLSELAVRDPKSSVSVELSAHGDLIGVDGLRGSSTESNPSRAAESSLKVGLSALGDLIGVDGLRGSRTRRTASSAAESFLSAGPSDITGSGSVAKSFGDTTTQDPSWRALLRYTHMVQKRDEQSSYFGGAMQQQQSCGTEFARRLCFLNEGAYHFELQNSKKTDSAIATTPERFRQHLEYGTTHLEYFEVFRRGAYDEYKHGGFTGATEMYEDLCFDVFSRPFFLQETSYEGLDVVGRPLNELDTLQVLGESSTNLLEKANEGLEKLRQDLGTEILDLVGEVGKDKDDAAAFELFQKNIIPSFDAHAKDLKNQLDVCLQDVKSSLQKAVKNEDFEDYQHVERLVVPALPEKVLSSGGTSNALEHGNEMEVQQEAEAEAEEQNQKELEENVAVQVEDAGISTRYNEEFSDTLCGYHKIDEDDPEAVELFFPTADPQVEGDDDERFRSGSDDESEEEGPKKTGRKAPKQRDGEPEEEKKKVPSRVFLPDVALDLGLGLNAFRESFQKARAKLVFLKDYLKKNIEAALVATTAEGFSKAGLAISVPAILRQDERGDSTLRMFAEAFDEFSSSSSSSAAGNNTTAKATSVDDALSSSSAAAQKPQRERLLRDLLAEKVSEKGSWPAAPRLSKDLANPVEEEPEYVSFLKGFPTHGGFAPIHAVMVWDNPRNPSEKQQLHLLALSELEEKRCSRVFNLIQRAETRLLTFVSGSSSSSSSQGSSSGAEPLLREAEEQAPDNIREKPAQPVIPAKHRSQAVRKMPERQAQNFINAHVQRQAEADDHHLRQRLRQGPQRIKRLDPAVVEQRIARSGLAGQTASIWTSFPAQGGALVASFVAQNVVPLGRSAETTDHQSTSVNKLQGLDPKRLHVYSTALTPYFILQKDRERLLRDILTEPSSSSPEDVASARSSVSVSASSTRRGSAAWETALTKSYVARWVALGAPLPTNTNAEKGAEAKSAKVVNKRLLIMTKLFLDTASNERMVKQAGSRAEDVSKAYGLGGPDDAPSKFSFGTADLKGRLGKARKVLSDVSKGVTEILVRTFSDGSSARDKAEFDALVAILLKNP